MFTFADLFAGIGGFHAALSAAGGRCVFASEIDPAASAVYQLNWGDRVRVDGDIVPLTEPTVSVPQHDVLAAGFPCQPFSKSGHQLGMQDARGTLFWSICRVLEACKPSLVLLENVRNIAGPRHRHEWQVIVTSLRELGYVTSSAPTVFSPHLLPPWMGGTPQVRERVFIVGVHVGRERAVRDLNVPPVVENRPVAGWDPASWDVERHLLQPDDEVERIDLYRLTRKEETWIEVWEDLVQRIGTPLPGFPLWADAFKPLDELDLHGVPTWKAVFLEKNSAFYVKHREVIDDWLATHNHLDGFPLSRRKLEWQARGARSLWDTVIQLRPSGIRAKAPTYLPALVAITQTSIIGWRRRRITPREAARLQGLPDWFGFGDQPDKDTYRQLGNAVAVGAAYHVLRSAVAMHQSDLPTRVVEAVLSAPLNPVVPSPTR